MPPKNKNNVAPGPEIKVEAKGAIVEPDTDKTPVTICSEFTSETSLHEEDPEENKTLARAVSLLLLAQKGMNVIIGGSGPHNDLVNGIYFSNVIDNESDRFLLEQWNKEVDDLVEELESTEVDLGNE